MFSFLKRIKKSFSQFSLFKITRQESTEEGLLSKDEFDRIVAKLNSHDLFFQEQFKATQIDNLYRKENYDRLRIDSEMKINSITISQIHCLKSLLESYRVKEEESNILNQGQIQLEQTLSSYEELIIKDKLMSLVKSLKKYE